MNPIRNPYQGAWIVIHSLYMSIKRLPKYIAYRRRMYDFSKQCKATRAAKKAALEKSYKARGLRP